MVASLRVNQYLSRHSTSLACLLAFPLMYGRVKPSPQQETDANSPKSIIQPQAPSSTARTSSASAGHQISAAISPLRYVLNRGYKLIVPVLKHFENARGLALCVASSPSPAPFRREELPLSRLRPELEGLSLNRGPPWVIQTCPRSGFVLSF